MHSSVILVLAPTYAAAAACIDAIATACHALSQELGKDPMNLALASTDTGPRQYLFQDATHICQIVFVWSPSLKSSPIPLYRVEGVILVNPEDAPKAWPMFLRSAPYFRVALPSPDALLPCDIPEEHGFQTLPTSGDIGMAILAFPWSSSDTTSPPLTFPVGPKRLQFTSLVHVDLSNCGLTAFPQALLTSGQMLEVLNLGGNRLSSLPGTMVALKKLRILFFASNAFTSVPIVLGSLPTLYMLSFKSNMLTVVPEASLSPSLGWLILTDNRIDCLPASLGKCSGMRKLMLANNRLSALPDQMANLKELELLRLAANRFKRLPDWLFRLPKLSWLAIAGNPCCTIPDDSHVAVPDIPFGSISVGQILGQGASGTVHACTLTSVVEASVDTAAATTGFAVKLFKGDATSDGLPADEMGAALQSGRHKNLIQVLGIVTGAPAPALLLPRIPKGYVSLGNPPSFESVTRDTYSDTVSFSLSEALCILSSLASVGAHLHARGISHGDLYAHNILIDRKAQHVLLVDFGAASFYDPLCSEPLPLEPIEIRAFGCLMEDILSRVECTNEGSWMLPALWKLQGACVRGKPGCRPSFQQLVNEFTRLESAGSAVTVENTAVSRKRIMTAAAIVAAAISIVAAIRK